MHVLPMTVFGQYSPGVRTFLEGRKGRKSGPLISAGPMAGFGPSLPFDETVSNVRIGFNFESSQTLRIG